MTDYRLLITGSRNWDHPESVFAVLSHYCREAHALGGRLVVVHGKAHKGGDNLAAAWATRWGNRGYPVIQEAHPARWGDPCVYDGTEPCQPGHRQRHKNGPGDYCPMAGHRRNQHMVDTRPLVTAAFWRAGSSGTKDCIRRAEAAGIPVTKVLWAERNLALAPEWLLEHAKLLRVAA